MITRRRHLGWIALAAGLALATAQCSDDDTSGNDSGPAADTGGPAQDGAADQTVPDTGPAPDQGIPVNSGAICLNAEEDCAPGDSCVSISFGKRMCMSSCTPGKACEVPNPVVNASQCAWRLTDPATGAPQYFCAWFCLRQGKTYQCPNDTDYNCSEWPGLEAGTKVCIPK